MGRPKFKLVVKDVYNSDYNSAEYHGHNMKKLVSYVVSNTDKLGTIGAYLVEKLGRRVRKGQDGHIFTTMAIFNELIAACHAHLALFGPHVVAACKMVLAQRASAGEWAVVTFEAYVSRLEDMTQLDWEYFVQLFNRMAAAKAGAADQQRLVGLHGLAAFCAAMDDSDAFVARYVLTELVTAEERAANVLLTVVTAVQSEALAPSARRVLEALASRTNALSFRFLLATLFRIFGQPPQPPQQQSLWATNVPLDCLGSMSVLTAKREVIVALVQEVDAMGVRAVALATQIAAGDDTWKGPVVAIVEPLIAFLKKHLDAEAQVSDCLVALVSGERSEHAAEQLEAVAIMADLVEPASAVESNKAVLRCALAVARKLQPKVALDVNGRVLRRVLRLALEVPPLRSDCALLVASLVRASASPLRAAQSALVRDALFVQWTDAQTGNDAQDALSALLSALLAANADEAALTLSMLVQLPLTVAAVPSRNACFVEAAQLLRNDALLAYARDVSPIVAARVVALTPQLETCDTAWAADSDSIRALRLDERPAAPFGSTANLTPYTDAPLRLFDVAEAAPPAPNGDVEPELDIEAIERLARETAARNAAPAAVVAKDEFVVAQERVAREHGQATEARRSLELDVDVYLRTLDGDFEEDEPIAFPPIPGME